MKRANKNIEQQIIELTSTLGSVRASDLIGHGFRREYLSRMHHKGLLQRIARGRYALVDADISAHHGMALFANQVSGGVITLISALAFHQIGTQNPHELWVAVKARGYAPDLVYPKVRYHYYSGAAYKKGIEEHRIDGVNVKIYSPAKTVVDCFRMRNKVGLDVALEALKEGWRDHRFTADELMLLAKECRIASVIQPHFEMLVA